MTAYATVHQISSRVFSTIFVAAARSRASSAKHCRAFRHDLHPHPVLVSRKFCTGALSEARKRILRNSSRILARRTTVGNPSLSASSSVNGVGLTQNSAYAGVNHCGTSCFIARWMRAIGSRGGTCWVISLIARSRIFSKRNREEMERSSTQLSRVTVRSYMPSYRKESRQSSSRTVTPGRDIAVSSDRPSSPAYSDGHANISRKTSESRFKKYRCTLNRRPPPSESVTFVGPMRKCANDRSR